MLNSRKLCLWISLFWAMVSFEISASEEGVDTSGVEYFRGSKEVMQLRPVNSAYSLNIGTASILDTYLTGVRYHGKDIRLGYERMQAMRFNPMRWIMQMDFGIDYAAAKNNVGNRTIHYLTLDYAWRMLWRYRPPINGLQLYAGGEASFNGGVIYDKYNSNNPVSVKIRASVGVSGMVAYNMRLWKLPVTFRYQCSLPVAGVFFSPEYDESFFEIYVGNDSGLMHFGWWGNRFDMVNILSADLHFGATVLRLGYRGRIESSWICNLNTQIFTNTFTIALAGDWISISPSQHISRKAKVISAIY